MNRIYWIRMYSTVHCSPYPWR